MKLNEYKNIDEILNFIENELRSTEHPIFVEICKKVLDTYNVDIYPAKMAQICKEISKRKGLNKDFSSRCRPLTTKKRALLESMKEADNSGITDEEIYLCRLRGFSYGVMCRIYFELTGKLLSSTYFSNKFINYCNEHKIPVSEHSIAKRNPDAFNNISAQDLANHSAFFNKMYSKSKVRNSTAERTQSTIKLIDPYKKLHEEMKDDTTLLTDFDER